MQSHFAQHFFYRGSKYTRCEEEVQCIIFIIVGVGASGAQRNHRSETGAAKDGRSKRITAKERTKTTVRPAQVDLLPRDGT